MPSDKDVIDFRREAKDSLNLAQDNLAATMESLSPLVEEIVSQADPIQEALQWESLPAERRRVMHKHLR